MAVFISQLSHISQNLCFQNTKSPNHYNMVWSTFSFGRLYFSTITNSQNVCFQHTNVPNHCNMVWITFSFGRLYFLIITNSQICVFKTEISQITATWCGTPFAPPVFIFPLSQILKILFFKLLIFPTQYNMVWITFCFARLYFSIITYHVLGTGGII